MTSLLPNARDLFDTAQQCKDQVSSNVQTGIVASVASGITELQIYEIIKFFNPETCIFQNRAAAIKEWNIKFLSDKKLV